VLTRRPDAPGNDRLGEAAAARGHVLELIESGAVSLTFEHGLAGLARHDTALPHYDAVVSRLGGTAALVRQLELMGSFALNPGDALERLRSGVGIVQALVRAGLEAPSIASPAPWGTFASSAAVPRLRLLVVSDAVVAAIEIRRGRAWR
jgi:hypothetical protein